MDAHKELDILEMPVEALAAYWLSIKKLLDAKKDLSLLAVEAENTAEPFIRHLLDTAQSNLRPSWRLPWPGPSAGCSCPSSAAAWR